MRLLRANLVTHPVSWVVASFLGTTAAGMALPTPAFSVSPASGQERLPAEAAPAAEVLSPLAGQVVPGGEARFRPLGSRSPEARRPMGRQASDGAERDELVAGSSGNPFFLGFAGGRYEPPVEERIDPLLAQELQSLATDGRPSDVTYGFVMFSTRIDAERVAALEALGVRVLGYHPSNCLRVALPKSVVDSVASLEFVRWVGAARTWQKQHPMLQTVLSEDSSEQVEVYVSVFESDLNEDSERRISASAQLVSPDGIEPTPPQPAGEPTGSTWRTNGWQEAALAARGVEIDEYSSRSDSFRGRLPRTRLEAVAALDFVQFIEPWIEPTAAHDESMAFVHSDLTRASWDGGTNDAVVVGEADTGIDSGHSGLNHFYGWGWDLAASGTGPWNDGYGHGSHVAGTIFGKADVDRSLDGMAPFLGSAPNLRIFNTKIFNDFGSWGGSTMANILDHFDNDLTDNNSVVTPKPHVINHSWGTVGSGWTGSEVDCRELDTDIWALGQMHVFAAGNEGSGAGTLRMQAAAKNVFTVGNVLDHYNASVGFPGSLWTSSSRGPTGDLRWKPNVVAPGRWIDSVDAGTSTGYTEYSGTSMAAPHVTGLAAQLCDHFSFLRYKASTLGAVMMASAMTRNGALLSAPSTSGTAHHNTYGAGRIEALKAHNLSSQAMYFWGFDMTSTTGYVELDFPVGANATQLSCVTLYHEIPASAGASVALVNDLDMYIDRAPFSAGGNTGEYFAHQSSRDNAETRTIANPLEADYRIKIYPEDLPAGFLNVVRVGVAVVVTYGDTTPAATLTTSVDDAYVKPNDVVQLTANVFNPSYVASAVYLNQGQTGTLLGAETTLKDGHVADLSDNVYDGDRVLLGDIRNGQSRSVRWTARWATEGVKTWSVNMDSENAGSPSSSKNVTVDGTPPSGPTNLSSAGHPVNGSSCVGNTTVQWTAANDTLSGVDGYSALFNHSAATNAPTTANLGAGATSFNQNLAASGSPWYFHVRAVDRSGNWGATQHYGPFFIVSGGTSTYCSTSPNSVGPGATMLSAGSTSIAANNFQLVATGLPAGQPSLFFFGPNAANIPFGNGTRCVGGQIVRLPVVYTQNGTTSYTLNFNAPPVATFIDAGETWRFQNWYRDPQGGGAFFNLTNGLRVTFCE